MSRSRRSLSRVLRIDAWIVTSSAVVGSSASSSDGPHAMAIAMTTRCAMPPDISCGYWSKRRAGIGDADRARSSIARSLGALRSTRSWRSKDLADLATHRQHRVERCHRLLEHRADLAPGSAACVRPTRSEGPRRASRTRPAVTAPPSGSRPRIDIASIVFPQPDSPTTATISPCSTAKETSIDRLDGVARPGARSGPMTPSTSRTALIGPSFGSRTSRRPSPTRLNDSAVRRMARPGTMIPNHGAGADVWLRGREHHAPGGRGRLDAETRGTTAWPPRGSRTAA